MFILVGLIYVIALSILISALVDFAILQTILLIVLEGAYFTLIFLKKPFNDKLVYLVILAQRGIYVFNSLLMLIVAIIDKDSGFTKFLHMLIFLLCLTSILGAIVLIIIKLVNKNKKVENFTAIPKNKEEVKKIIKKANDEEERAKEEIKTFQVMKKDSEKVGEVKDTIHKSHNEVEEEVVNNVDVNEKIDEVEDELGMEEI